ncbi:hypothetical protein PUV54_07405 [Hyphococcus flavus]|uniref:Uncharacterized protein n=1 Tax=Hyphococcus flavus TaxID=1866326 RepID=A0AAE9ZI28_9PROT|nr:hypothetical protein [Hyphococcus flavus]WDI33022.1 hypothetical protein PUV54_07405 [Hyphococcus flavus]
MESVGKIVVAIIAGIGGFVAMNLWGPFSGPAFDYPTATIDQKQAYLERKAKNFSRGFRLTAGSKAEISKVHVEAEYDLVSISVQLKDPNFRNVPSSEIEKFRKLILKTSCTLTERKLLTQTAFKLRVRYFHTDGSRFMSTEASRDNCASYLN